MKHYAGSNPAPITFKLTQMKWTESSFKLSNGTEFSICHNLPVKGYINSIYAALECWLARTEEFTQASFIEYINSKKAGFEAMTKEDWQKRFFN